MKTEDRIQETGDPPRAGFQHGGLVAWARLRVRHRLRRGEGGEDPARHGRICKFARSYAATNGVNVEMGK